MNQLPNTLLISGSGRNCGKTTLVCDLIHTMSNTARIIGLKITPHFHQTANNQQLIEEGLGYKIYRETDKGSGKDTARMLNAGASKVYFLQSDDNHLLHAARKLYQHIPVDAYVVCESGSLGLYFKPDYHVLVEGLNPDETKKSYLHNKAKADLIMSTVQIGPGMVEKIITLSSITRHQKTVYYDQARRSA